MLSADLAVFPPGASPHAVAGLLKQFLMGLPEPLLTYRCVCVGEGRCEAVVPDMLLHDGAVKGSYAACVGWQQDCGLMCVDESFSKLTASQFAMLPNFVFAAGCCRSGWLQEIALSQQARCCSRCPQPTPTRCGC